MANPTDDDLDPRLLRLSEQDNIAVLIAPLRAGERLRLAGREHAIAADIGLGHKLALRPLRDGETIYKYGAPIGSASADITVAEHVHVHNMKSDYIPNYSDDDPYAAEDGA
ncbi:MAG: UxaA family hydrolase [Alphaproteobacteria bacterium]|jgi:hypothetical protein|nr:UxaA family hydrolase [Alphaproteobacteria bacterium]MDP6566019.1 UxaA family hydrolase [Alphaproteobacteria bacterium]MDP6812266.1 UxaA family hydrolase [Alphaproteobacteria bacterium]